MAKYKALRCTCTSIDEPACAYCRAKALETLADIDAATKEEKKQKEPGNG